MNLNELPEPLQAVWNDVYQLVVKNLRAEGVDLPVAKSRARRAAEEHVGLYDVELGKWVTIKEGDDKGRHVYIEGGDMKTGPGGKIIGKDKKSKGGKQSTKKDEGEGLTQREIDKYKGYSDDEFGSKKPTDGKDMMLWQADRMRRMQIRTEDQYKQGQITKAQYRAQKRNQNRLIKEYLASARMYGRRGKKK